MILIEFIHWWRTARGVSVMFETVRPIDFVDYDSNIGYASTFRFDFDTHKTQGFEPFVYVVGDSEEQGFLVCEDVTSFFSTTALFLKFAIEKAQVACVTDEYEQWLKEYE